LFDSTAWQAAIVVAALVFGGIAMKVFTCSQARQNLPKLLGRARTEAVEIRRKDCSVFTVRLKRTASKSPFAVSGIKTKATTKDILDSVRESRERLQGVGIRRLTARLTREHGK